MKKRDVNSMVVFFGFMLIFAGIPKIYAGEHGGEPVKEHGGEAVKEKEHSGEKVQEHPGEEAVQFSENQIKKAIKEHVRSVSVKDVMTLKDDQSGEVLKLRFVKIHNPVRKMKDNIYFACTDFNVSGERKKVYDIDFWLKPVEGKLMVTQTKVHKHPIEEKGKWVKKARYTFKEDEIVPIP